MAFNNGSATNGAITQEQRTAARVAGSMYLLLGALAAFAEFYVRSGILVYGDAAQTAHNIVEIVTGFWLVVAGIRIPRIAQASPVPN